MQSELATHPRVKHKAAMKPIQTKARSVGAATDRSTVCRELWSCEKVCFFCVAPNSKLSTLSHVIGSGASVSMSAASIAAACYAVDRHACAVLQLFRAAAEVCFARHVLLRKLGCVTTLCDKNRFLILLMDPLFEIVSCPETCHLRIELEASWHTE